MGARDESTWPRFLRQRLAVDLLGPPSSLLANTTLALAFGLMLYVGLWNAYHYPIGLGYDATAHLEYAHILVHQRHIPSVSETAEGVQPPLYYAIAGLASAFGQHVLGWHESAALLPERSYRGAQYFNVLCLLTTALSVLWMARTLWPDRRWLAAAAVSFVAILPVDTKLTAMFHPENLNMAASAVAVAAATYVLAGGARRGAASLLLVAAVVIGLATRVSTLFTIAAIVVGFLIAASSPRTPWRPPWRTLGMVVAGLAAVGLVAVVLQTVVFHRQPFGTADNLASQVIHPSRSQGSVYRAPFFRVSFVPIFTKPYRTNFVDQAGPQTYVDIWGDWFGAFSWSAYSGAPTSLALTTMQNQSMIGVIPTLLAIGGWLALCVLAFRRRPELGVIALLPLFAVGGYLYRSYLILSADGDLLKAVYAVTSVPAWALSFGFATVAVGNRSRLLGIGLYVLLAAFAVIELRFTMYGVRDHVPPF